MRWVLGTISMRYLLAALAVTWLATVPAHADFSGNDFKEYCEFGLNIPKGALCRGYLIGTLDSIRTLGEDVGHSMFCQPVEAEPEQLIAIVQKYLADHPERLHLRASGLIMNSMIEAFPCPKK